MGLLVVCLAWTTHPAPGAADGPREGGAAVPPPAPLGALFPFGVPEADVAWEGLPGGPARRAAVERAMDWLAEHQAGDGSWQPHQLGWRGGRHDPDRAPPGPGRAHHAVGVTGLATSVFLTMGVAPGGTHRHAPVVQRALGWLLGVQDAEGCFGPRTSMAYIYGHAFALPAILEAWVLTGDARLQAAMQRGLDFTLLARNPGAGWRYGIQPGDSDSSATVSSAMPFALLHHLQRRVEAVAGEVTPSLAPTVRRELAATLDALTDEATGRTGYLTRGTVPARPADLLESHPPEFSEALTASAMTLRVLLLDEDPGRAGGPIALGLRLLDAHPPQWQSTGGPVDMYYWYYAALVCAALDHPLARRFDQALAGTLLQAQRTTGTPADVLGSWDPAGVWAVEAGRIYATAMGAMCLLAPFRTAVQPDDRPDLVQALGSAPDEDLVVRLCGAVARLDVAGAARPLAARLAQGTPRVRLAAAQALIALGETGSRTQRALRALVDGPEAAWHAPALLTLADLGTTAPEDLERFARAATDADAAVRAASQRGLAASTLPAHRALQEAALGDGAPEVRLAAATALDTAEACRVLEVLAGATDVAVRRGAVGALAATPARAAQAGATLTRALADGDAGVRLRAAAGVLAVRPGDSGALAIVAAALAAPAGEDAALAVEATARAGRHGAPLAAALARRVGLRRLAPAVLAALRALGPDAVPAAPQLAWLAAHGDARTAGDARDLLAVLGKDRARLVGVAVDALVGDPSRATLGAALLLRPLPREAIEPLRALLRGEPARQRAALDVIGEGGPAAALLVEDVGALLDAAAAADVRRRAAVVLGLLGPPARSALPALLRTIEDGDDALAASAMEAAVRVDADGAADSLVGAAFAQPPRRPRARLAALRALGGIPSRAEALVPRLLLVAKEEPADRWCTAAAQDALTALGVAAVPRLRAVLRESDTALLVVATGALAAMGAAGEDAVPELVALLLDAQRGGGRWGAADALGGIGKPAAKELKKLLRERDAWVRGQAARAFGLMGAEGRTAASLLRKMARSDDDVTAREAAASALKTIEAAVEAAKGR